MSPDRPAAPAVAAPGSAERRELAAQFVAAGELERRRIAEGIHDDSIQAITALGMRLQMLRRTLSDPAQVSLVADAEQTALLAIRRLRHLVVELQPPGLEQEGLSVAFAIACESAEHGGPGAFALDDRLASQPGAAAGAILFRIAQEALENAREHAGADSVSVTLFERDSGWTVRISDDGRGFDPGPAESWPSTGGLAAMRDRARLGGGGLRVESSPGAGTAVEAWLPDAIAGEGRA
jgi:signal transduction histidine kinase